MTRAELEEEFARFRAEIQGDIALAMNYIAGRMQAIRDDLTHQIANAAHARRRPRS